MRVKGASFRFKLELERSPLHTVGVLGAISRVELESRVAHLGGKICIFLRLKQLEKLPKSALLRHLNRHLAPSKSAPSRHPNMLRSRSNMRIMPNIWLLAKSEPELICMVRELIEVLAT